MNRTVCVMSKACGVPLGNKYCGGGCTAAGGGGPNVGNDPAGGASGVVAPYGVAGGWAKAPAVFVGGVVDQNWYAAEPLGE